MPTKRKRKGETQLRVRENSPTVDLVALLGALGVAGFFLVKHWNSPAYSLRRWGFCFLLTSLFAVAGWLAHGVNWSGALAGWAVAFVMAAAGWQFFVVLLLVFALTLVATRTGKRRKQELRTAETPAGRSASQVMANLGVAMLIVTVSQTAGVVLALAALAEAAADTSSSEIGMAFPGRTILITSGKAVTSGIDGGISMVGSGAAIGAAGIIALSALSMGMTGPWFAVVVIVAGVAGMLFDSFLGAVFERKGYLNNDAVNFLSTLFSVGIACVLV